MSSSSQEFDGLRSRKSPRKIFDEILVLADDLLKDECPISEVDEWLFRIDDILLQLKLWGETVGVERGLLEGIVLDKDLCLVIGEVLRSILLPLHKIEAWFEDPEAVELPQIKSRISAAIDEFQDCANSLTGTIELFPNNQANSNNDSFLQDFKLTGSIPDHFYDAYDLHGQDPSVGELAEVEQQQRDWENSVLLPYTSTESSYEVFLQALGKMTHQEITTIQFGELPILSEQMLIKVPWLKGRANWPADDIFAMIYSKEEILKVGATLHDFHKAWLETSFNRYVTADEIAEKRAHGLPHMAKVWLILHEMGSDHLLDSFCISQITDKSLPLDMSTLESILPPDEKENISGFAVRQRSFGPGSNRLAFLGDISWQASAPLDKPDLQPSEAPPGGSSPLAGTTTPAVDPPLKTAALNQPASTKKAFASTSAHSNDPTVDETLSLRQRR